MDEHRFAESRIRGETIAAEDVLHDMGAISIMASDSQVAAVPAPPAALCPAEWRRAELVVVAAGARASRGRAGARHVRPSLAPVALDRFLRRRRRWAGSARW